MALATCGAHWSRKQGMKLETHAISSCRFFITKSRAGGRGRRSGPRLKGSRFKVFRSDAVLRTMSL